MLEERRKDPPVVMQASNENLTYNEQEEWRGREVQVRFGRQSC